MRKLEVQPERLEPPLLKGRELLEDHIQVIIQLSARTEQPDFDGDGLFGSQAPVIFVNMLKPRDRE